MDANELLNEFATKDVVVKREIKLSDGNVTLLINTDLSDAKALREIISATEKAGKTSKVSAFLPSVEVRTIEEKCEAMESLLAGDALLFCDRTYAINVRKYEKRAIAEPPTETVMRGPREGFIEDLKTNLSLVKRRLRTPALAVEKMRIGRISSTTVAMVYLSTVASPKMIEMVRRRLRSVDIDCVTDSYYLRPLIEEHPYSIFSQSGVSEKPDVVCAKLAEGRVAIIVDGSPTVITVPFLMIEDFQSSEDYYERNVFSSFLRILRLISLVTGILLPGFYVALQMFHQEVLPVRFLVTLINAIEGIPLPPLSEVLFVLILFEIIREASVRMPRAVGMAMSIVGALVLGETAVKAGMISSPAVMIVALSSISLYTVPNQVGTMSLIRIIMLIAGGWFGFLGLLIATVVISYRLVTLDNFGVAYMAPFAPKVKSDLNDALVRAPINTIKTRPRSIPNINHTRQGGARWKKR